MKPTNLNYLDEQELPSFIAIEGPIGVGKSALAKRLAEQLNCHTLFENKAVNPFLAKYYQNPQQNALATQLSFLFQRIQLLQQLPTEDLFQSRYVSNFLIDKDQLFAQSILSPEEYALYQQVFTQTQIPSPKPGLVVYLQAPSDILLQRIQQRSEPYEQSLSLSYIDKINAAYSQFFHYYDEAPLLIVNAAQVDLINDDLAFNNLIKYMLSIQNGRHYFNPSFFTEAYA